MRAPDANTAPGTTIRSGPQEPTTSTSATFEFVSEAGARFECSLDRGAFASAVTTALLIPRRDWRNLAIATGAALLVLALPAFWRYDAGESTTDRDAGGHRSRLLHASEPGLGDRDEVVARLEHLGHPVLQAEALQRTPARPTRSPAGPPTRFVVASSHLNVSAAVRLLDVASKDRYRVSRSPDTRS